MAESSATATLRIRTTPETVDALAESFERLLAASKGVVTQSKVLTKEKQAVARGERAVESSTKAATKELRSEAGAARAASTANSDLAKGLGGLRTALLGGAAGFVTMEVAKKVFGATTRAVTSSIAAFARESAETQGEIDRLSAATTGLQSALGGALVGGEDGQRIFAALRGVVSALTNAVQQNAGAIRDLAVNAVGGLLQALPALVQVVAVGVNTVNAGRLAWLGLRVALDSATEGVAQIGMMLGRGLLQLLAAASNAVGSLSGSLAGLAEAAGLDSVAASLARGAEATERFAGAVIDAEGALGELSANSAAAHRRSLAEYGETAREIGQNMVAATNVADNLSAALSELSARFDAGDLSASDYAVSVQRVSSSAREAAGAIEALTAEQAKLLLAEGQIIDLRAQRLGIEQALTAQAEKAAQADAALAERESALAATAKQKTEAEARFQLQLERRVALAGQVSDSLTSLFEGIGSGLAEGKLQIGKVLGALLGDVLSQVGKTQIALGALNLIPPPFNPLGNPALGALQIAGGGAAVALGAALGGAASGGTPSRSSSAATGGGQSVGTIGALPAAASTTETYIFNNTANFGFVTDPEASAAAFSRAASGNRRLGY